MESQNALLRRNAKAKGEAVVPRAAMDPHAIRAAGPEAVVRNADAEEAKERPRRAEAEEPDLPAVRVTGEDEIGLSFGQMFERTRIVEKHDARGTRNARVSRADALEVRLAFGPHEIHAEDLHRARVGLDERGAIEEELDAVLDERPLHDLGSLVIVIAETGEDFARQLSERL